MIRYKIKKKLPVYTLPSAPPPLECLKCTIGMDCREYRPGYVCAFETILSTNGINTKDTIQAHKALEEIALSELRRYRFGLMLEQQVSGGLPNATVTAIGESAFAKLKQITALEREMLSIRVTAQSSGSQSTGILQKLFGAPAVKTTDEIQINSEADVVSNIVDDKIDE